MFQPEDVRTLNMWFFELNDSQEVCWLAGWGGVSMSQDGGWVGWDGGKYESRRGDGEGLEGGSNRLDPIGTTQ